MKEHEENAVKQDRKLPQSKTLLALSRNYLQPASVTLVMNVAGVTLRKFAAIQTEIPISVAAPSKSWVCGRSLAGIAGSSAAWGMNVCLLSVGCCQVEVFCGGPITRPEESYRAWCVCDIKT
jgi:hypothetical protein